MVNRPTVSVHRRTIPFDFYERGYWDTIQFSYVPDDMTLEEVEAYGRGIKDGKAGITLDYQEYKEKYEKPLTQGEVE